MPTFSSLSLKPEFQPMAYVLRKIVIAIPFLLFTTQAFSGDTLYIRGNAVGNNDGSDWFNAFTSFSAANLHNTTSNTPRGNTYYVADGSYGKIAFRNTGTDTITIKKATKSDHGTSAGWDSSYGDGQATFTYFDFYSDHFIVDGNITNGYGFALSGTTGDGTVEFSDYGRSSSDQSDFITLRSATINCQGVARRRGMYIISSTNLTIDNVEIWNCDDDTVFMDLGKNIVFNNMYLHKRNNAGVGTHGDAMQIHSSSNVTISNSRFSWDGQNIFWGGNTSGSNGRFDIYGNRFWGGETSGQALCRNSSGTGGPIYFYNNSISNMNTQIMEGGMNYQGVKNNVFVCNDHVKNISVPNMSHNYYSTECKGYSDPAAQIGGNPFVNSSNGDFALIDATNPGLDLSGFVALAGNVSLDPNGKSRGGDGTWDRGALDSAEGGTATDPLGVPGNLRFATD